MSIVAQHLTSIASALPADATALESAISALKSSISALESSISSLDSWSAFWERLLPFSTVLVVIGVTAEIWLIVWEHNEELDAWRRGIVLPPDRPSRIKLCVGIVATALVVFGVFGELAVGLVITHINGQLRTKNSEMRSDSDQLLALVTEVAGDANTSAQKAGVAASGATCDANLAKASSLEAKQHATEIGNELEKETEREQAAERQLEGERIKRLRLAVSLRDRELYDQSGIITQLSSLPPHRVIFVYLNESEPRQFAEQIAVVFSVLKWPFVGRPISDDSAFFPGVSITSGYRLPRSGSSADIMREMQEQEAGITLAETLQKVFADAHVDLAANQFTGGFRNESPSTILIGIGPKPNTELEEALRELGEPEAAPLGGAKGLKMGGNRVSIPLDPAFKPNSGNP